jgi:sugar phosphate isomerase/epimerase
MTNRREFIIKSSALFAGTLILPSCMKSESSEENVATDAALAGSRKVENVGVQLYTFRDAMAKDALGTLEKIAALGYKEIESARSGMGHYYGLKAAGMKKACIDLGMVLRSGHVHLDEDFDKTIAEAVESGQEYLICSSMPKDGQTIDNYKATAEAFNKAGEQCKANGIKFGYHNHDYEFESDGDQVLYDVLMDNTQTDLVYMELDLGWVIVAGKDPLDYFARYEGRFPLWHLKDMNMTEKQSTEFGKGGLDILKMLQNGDKSGVKHVFVEQEEYTIGPFEAMANNMAYLNKLRY